MYDLLTEKLIRTKTIAGGMTRETLPGLMALLMKDQVESLPALRAHQRHALHSMLVQIATAALEDQPPGRIPETEEEWRRLLEILQPVRDGPQTWHQAWHLIGQDLRSCAFMQPPMGQRGKATDFTKTLQTPGALDILVYSKNHEIKRNQVQQPELDDWIMALITVQTMDNASGAGRKGISRSMDGTASRTAFSIMPLYGGFGAEVRRDVGALRIALPGIRERYPRYPHQGGITLTWAHPWDGAADECLRMEDLHPLYIDTCRRIRLQTKEGVISAQSASSKTTRIARETYGGLTGDPWAPVNREKQHVLKLTGHAPSQPSFPNSKKLAPNEGFSYRNLTRLLLSDEWEHPPLLQPTPEEIEAGQPMKMVARCLRRYQGKTFGYEDRQVVINHHLRRALTPGADNLEAGEIAMARIADIDQMEGVLRTCLRLYMDGGIKVERPARTEPREHARSSLAAIQEVEQAIDDTFFQDLQDEVEAPQSHRNTVRAEWMTRPSTGLIDRTRQALRNGMDSAPYPGILRMKGHAQAESYLEGWLRSKNGFPNLFQTKEEEEKE